MTKKNVNPRQQRRNSQQRRSEYHRLNEYVLNMANVNLPPPAQDDVYGSIGQAALRQELSQRRRQRGSSPSGIWDAAGSVEPASRSLVRVPAPPAQRSSHLEDSQWLGPNRPQWVYQEDVATAADFESMTPAEIESYRLSLENEQGRRHRANYHQGSLVAGYGREVHAHSTRVDQENYISHQQSWNFRNNLVAAVRSRKAADCKAVAAAPSQEVVDLCNSPLSAVDTNKNDVAGTNMDGNLDTNKNDGVAGTNMDGDFNTECSPTHSLDDGLLEDFSAMFSDEDVRCFEEE